MKLRYDSHNFGGNFRPNSVEVGIEVIPNLIR